MYQCLKEVFISELMMSFLWWIFSSAKAYQYIAFECNIKGRSGMGRVEWGEIQLLNLLAHVSYVIENL